MKLRARFSLLLPVPSTFRLMALCFAVVATSTSPVQPAQAQAENPLIWADVPDPSVVRVGDVYYMSSTTMHVNPGVPIMRSTDLVNWEIVGYPYDVLADNDALALRNGQDAYGDGTWASSIRYRDGVYYVVTFSYSTNRTHIYQTTNVETGPWSAYTLPNVYHDPALFFEDDGSAYLVYGVDDIRIVELTPDVTAVKPGGLNQVIIPRASQIAGTEFIVPAEGSHLHKVEGRYYVFLISWPRGGMRTQLVYRADSLTGTYEGRIVLQDSGIAQGGLVDTPDGDWYALLFQDSGAVGRIPWLMPVRWEDGWPVLGTNGRAPRELDLPPGTGLLPGIVTSDEFDDYAAASGEAPELHLAWQWNHNPLDAYWSVTDRPDHLRLTTDRVDASLVATRNTLTQRTYGPQSTAHVAMDLSGMKNGDVAGLGALQANYGFVGVRRTEGASYVVMMDGSQNPPVEAAAVPFDAERIYLRIDANFRNRTDRATFLYSLDGENWETIGSSLRMSYTLPHFMGYRFALFNFATEEAGGFVDFDYFRTGYTYEESLPTEMGKAEGPETGGFAIGANYPNPVSGSTHIGYEVATTTEVRIDLFDVTGRRIDTLLNAVCPPGRHMLTFDAASYPSGPYFFRMRADDYIATRAMVVVR